MGPFYGMIQRPIVTVTAVAVASITSDVPGRFIYPKSNVYESITSPNTPQHNFSTLKLSTFPCIDFAHGPASLYSQIQGNYIVSTHRQIPAFVPNITFPCDTTTLKSVPSLSSSFIASSPFMSDLYHTTQLGKPWRLSTFKYKVLSPAKEILYKWHLPESSDYNSDRHIEKSGIVVVLLGWLGAKQNHLKMYAKWYSSMGFHVITFSIPLAEVVRYQIDGKAEAHVDLLVHHLCDWLEDEPNKSLMFHTFSNTGWLTYGAILEKFHEKDSSLLGRIRGCVVDSAPVDVPDPQVWAMGFSAAFLKKKSVATKGSVSSTKPSIPESALLLLLEKFFNFAFTLPSVHKRLGEVLHVLKEKQPGCAQLYMYSTGDRVIPYGSVESFVERQQRAGVDVRSCNFGSSSPHVDHFRTNPTLYTSHLSSFLHECLLHPPPST